MKFLSVTLLFCFSVFVAANGNGKISCDRPCPMNLDPVCASNGETYSNWCAYENSLCGVPSVKAHEVVHSGPCKPKAQTLDIKLAKEIADTMDIKMNRGKILCERPCPMIYLPVCGTNGVTYSSECHFENALCGHPSKDAFTIAHKGPCKPKAETMDKRGNGKIMCEKPCPMIYKPVCASNGETYDNECAFDNALCGHPTKDAFKIQHKGACKPKAETMDKRGSGKIMCEQACPMIYLPVCGTNGVTYSSECHFENALCGHPTKEAFTIAHKGACKPKAETMDKRSGKIMCEQPCPMIHKPVCGTNGVTYSSECHFENALCGVPTKKAFTIAHKGACKPKAETMDKRSGKIMCEQPCPMIHKPVCGTNGVTYSSECHFENALCGVPTKKSFTIAHKGACKPKAETMDKRGGGKIMCEQPCPMIFDPVCASNGVTYDNQCAFDNALCGISSKKAFKMVHKGPCKEIN